MYHSTMLRRPSEEQQRGDEGVRVRNNYTPSPLPSALESTYDPTITTNIPPHLHSTQHSPLPVPAPIPGRLSNSNTIMAPSSVERPPDNRAAMAMSTYFNLHPESTETRPNESPVSRPTSYVGPGPSAGILPKYYGGLQYQSAETSSYRSPPISHSHPAQAIGQTPRPSTMMSPTQNGAHMGGSIAVPEINGLDQELVPAAVTPARRSDPMAFSSILSNSEPSETRSATPLSNSRKPQVAATPPPMDLKNDPHPSSVAPASTPTSCVPMKRNANGEPKVAKNAKPKTVPKPTLPLQDEESDIQAVLARIDGEASDMDPNDFREEMLAFKVKCLKRKLDIQTSEIGKTQFRRKYFADDMARRLAKHARYGEVRYQEGHGDEACAIAQEKEVQADKYRKKSMQRKRRRERTAAQALEQKDSAMAKAAVAVDEAERQKFIREAQRAERKAQQTQIILARGEQDSEIRTVSPVEPNLLGGAMSIFPTVEEPKKSKRGGARPRKSKEQKQAEKGSAEAAQAAIDNGEAVATTPREEHKEPKIKLKINAKDKDHKADASPDPFEPYVSKGYNQIYEQIWRDLARKDINKVFKLAGDFVSTRASNLKKTAILASKEAKRWQLRTNKGTKDLQARAKRVMREMLQFWKRNEKDERDLRRAAEKQETENAKKLEADREANRQKRKLNFLIQQTELYSHFIGKKIKTDEVERSTDHPDVANPAKETPTLTTDVAGQAHDGVAAAKLTNFEDLDFDADDDSALKAAAMANAQNAIQEAQNKARAFNNQPAEDPAMDEAGEMNFQNPAGMGDVDIQQPKMLQAQLKEYQLKGLNWLANLYEQGINGILADEMGLGKTVQSISVMGYLAETHGIWGPYLVVAPASTLHNWQQEITRFVPKLKVLPYWGTANDRKILRKFWDRKKITYTEDASFHVLVTSYQLVVSDVAYFQKMKWQYMILDEAQAIKSSQSSRWKSLLGFHCRNRLLLTGTPIQNNMQELWALLHFIMPTLFDSHDEFSEWFSKDIESHAQTNTKLNEDQLKRLHMILKPFMLRRVKKHVQKELGDKIEIDLFCDLTYRQRKIYSRLRSEISLMDLLEKAAMTCDSGDSDSLMNLVMQFRKVCNHPDLFQVSQITSPLACCHFAETGSFLREGPLVNVLYSVRSLIEYRLPRKIWREDGRVRLPDRNNAKAGFRGKYLDRLFSVWGADNIHESRNDAFSWLRFSDVSAGEASSMFRQDIFSRSVNLARNPDRMGAFSIAYGDEDDTFTPTHALFRIVDRQDRKSLAETTSEGYLNNLMNVSKAVWSEHGYGRFEKAAAPKITAPPIDVVCSSRGAVIEHESTRYDMTIRGALYGPLPRTEYALIEAKIPFRYYPMPKLLPPATAEKQGFTEIRVPSRRRLVSDSGKLSKLDVLLHKLKEEGHRVLLYFQMTKMIDLMEEYLTYRSYRYLRLDGSTKLEDRRDTVHDFQTRPEIFIFLLSTRAGGLGINLTSADTVIFYDSDWNPTIDSQAMDRAHRLGQTKQVTVYRMITRGTIEERIRKRALQKEEVQKVVMTGGSSGGVDFNTRSRESRNKEVAMWLVNDEEQGELERLERVRVQKEENEPKKKAGGRKRKAGAAGGGSLEDMYHEGEGHFDDGSNRPSGAATPIDEGRLSKKQKNAKRPTGKKAKTAKQRLAIADGGID